MTSLPHCLAERGFVGGSQRQGPSCSVEGPLQKRSPVALEPRSRGLALALSAARQRSANPMKRGDSGDDRAPGAGVGGPAGPGPRPSARQPPRGRARGGCPTGFSQQTEPGLG